MLKLHDIRKVQIELTTRCNARCPMCMRNYRGFDFNSGYPDTELTLANIQHIFRPAFLQQLKQINLNGNLGDFALARDAEHIVKFFVEHNITVNINTNGSLRSPDWWARLALPRVTVGFALDGLADTHSLYRQDTDWHRVIANAKALIDAGGRAVWRFIPFDHNRHQEDQCRQMASDMGFVKFENIFDGRDRTPVYSRDGNFSHHVGAEYPNTPAQVHGLLQNHVTWYDARTVRHVKDVPNIEMACIHKRDEELYLAADGSVYPCCFLGFYPHSMNHPGNRELAQLVKENNALEHDLEHCLAWFDSIEQAWHHDSIAQGRPYQCVNTCAKIPQNYDFS